ncbi:hypothetical protein LTR86_010646 [Recurvomyces mirabilis]|nr:hypothetical protein LTR86_010646 [Recurvomyces mirabilis]
MPPASGPKHDSPLSALQREAEMDLDSEVQDLLDAGTRTDSGMKMRAWRRNVNQRATELSEEADDDECDLDEPGGDDGPATPSGAGPTHEQMMQIFPPIKRAATTTTDGMQGLESDDVRPPSKPKHNRYRTHQLRHLSPAESQSTTILSTTTMGLFALLPGELRNTIYRLAFVPPPSHQPVLITGSDLICGLGACVHHKASVAAPVASTCRQIREEVMPIFCAENEFRFDAVMVRNRGDGRFQVGFSEEIPREKLEASGLEELIGKLNDGGAGEEGQIGKLCAFLGSDELAELVFRCKK